MRMAMFSILFCLGMLAWKSGKASLLDPFQDSLACKLLGDNVDQPHSETQTNPKKTPILAVVSFQGNFEAYKSEIYADGWSSRRIINIVKDLRVDSKLDLKAFVALTNLMLHFPPGTNADYIEEKSRIISVSWRDTTNWVNRTYDQASPPAELLELYGLMGWHFPFICKELPTSVPAQVKEFSGPIRFIGAACDRGLVVSRDGNIILLDSNKSGDARFFSGSNLGTNTVETLAVTPDATKVAIACVTNLGLQDLDSGKILWRGQFHGFSAPSKMTLAPDASGLLAGCLDGLFLYNTSSNSVPKQLWDEAFTTQDWSRNGKWIAATHGEIVKIWDETGEPVCTLTNPSPGYCVSFSPDSTKLAVGLMGDIQVFDIRKQKLAFQIPWCTANLGYTLIDTPEQLVWSPDGKFLAVRGAQCLVLCEIAKRVPIAWEYGSLASPATFDRKGDSLIGIGTNNRIYSWKLWALNLQR